jgi:lambda family phage portal protein
MINVRTNLLDRAIGYVAPVHAAKRMAARASMSMFGGSSAGGFGGGYVGGSRDRRATRNWRPPATDANSDTLGDLRDLRARSRDLVRNVPLATGAVSTVVTNVVGDGLTLQPQVDFKTLGISQDQARAWQDQALREFNVWARHPDFTDRLNFDEMQAVVLRGALESGDIFTARRRRIDPGDTYGLKLQLIEADRVSNPNFGFNAATQADGVALDSDGRPTGYWISTMHPQEFTVGKRREWKLYNKGSSVTGAPLILHLYDQLRPDQARGVPYQAPFIEAIKQLGDYTDAEVKAAVAAAFLAFFIKHETEEAGDTPTVGTADDSDNVDKDREFALGPAAVVDLGAGEEIQFPDTKRPNIAFEAFCNAMASQIGVALELPRELLLKTFNTSYSASRAALEMGWQFFRRRRSWLAWKFCQPVYEWVITEAIANGRMAADGYFEDPVAREAWLGSDWIGPARIQLDPLKEAKADETDLAMRTKTRTQIIMERTGGSFPAKAAQLGEEERALRDAGVPSSTAGTQLAGKPLAENDPSANPATND